MERTRACVLSAMALLTGLACGPSGPRPAAGMGTADPKVDPVARPATGPVTARANLEKAKEMARGWQDDAELLSMRSHTASVDGSAAPGQGLDESWNYIFYSKGKDRHYVITVKDTGLEADERLDTAYQVQFFKPLPYDVIDSDRAMEAVKASGGKLEAQGISMNLWHKLGHPQPEWDIRDSMTGYIVDAKTGKLLVGV